jgi:hypothetical protein
MESQEVAVVEQTGPVEIAVFGSSRPTEIVGRASEVANILVPIIEERKLYKMIGPKKHVFAEGWTAMLSLIGVFPVPEWSRRLEREDEIAYESRVVLKTLSGQTVGAGEAICSSKERNWSNRDEYAIKSMSQTRATGKACRLPFSWIMILGGYEATPAEEMDGIERVNVMQPQPKAKPVESVIEFGGDPVAPPVVPPAESNPNGPRLISEKQQKMLFARWRAAGFEADALKKHLEAAYGLAHTKDLNRKQFDEILALIEKEKR